MAENSIDLVRKAEAEAEEVLREASRKAAQIVDEAQKRAVQLDNDAEDAAREKAAGNVANAHGASQKALEAAMADLDGEMAALAEKAHANQGEAVKMILNALTQ